MAANNLRILYANKLTGVSGGTNPANALTDYKSQWATGNTFTLTTSSISGPVVVVAMLTEDTASINMRVVTTGTNDLVSDTTASVIGSAAVGFGGGKYVALYTTLDSAVTSFTITFSRSVKVSRFLVGNYWVPEHNTSFGVQTGYADSSQYERLHSGDLYATPGPRHKTLSFSLEYLTDADKFKLFDILKTIGKSKPLFVSLFPNDTDKELEQMYCIYGRLSSVPGITYAMFTKYSSQLELEEI